MEASEDKKLEVIKVSNDTGGTAHPKEGGDTATNNCNKGFGFDSKSRYNNILNILLPYVLMSELFLNGSNSPFDMSGSNSKCVPETLKSRKCALPECDVHFVPSRASEICCTKEHFLILRDRQKLRIKSFQKKKHKHKRRKNDR